MIKVQQLSIEEPGIAAILWDMMHLHLTQIKSSSILTSNIPTSDPGSATYYSNQALQLFEEGHDEVTEPAFGEALKIQEEQLGPQHPDTVRSLNFLAGLYYRQKKYMLAESLLKRVLMLQEQQEGTESFAALLTRHNLAELYKDREQDKQAEQLLKRPLLDEQPEQTPVGIPSLEERVVPPPESTRLLRTERSRVRYPKHRRSRVTSRKRTKSSLQSQHRPESRFESSEPSPIWNVPFQQDPYFTGRKER